MNTLHVETLAIISSKLSVVIFHQIIIIIVYATYVFQCVFTESWLQLQVYNLFKHKKIGFTALSTKVFQHI